MGKNYTLSYQKHAYECILMYLQTSLLAKNRVNSNIFVADSESCHFNYKLANQIF